MKKIVYVTIVACVLGAIFLMTGFTVKSEKTGYVEIQKVFGEFEYRKELESNLKKMEMSRRSVIDSLELQLRSMSRQIGESNGNKTAMVTDFQVKKEEFLRTREKYQREYDEAVKTFDEMIFKQINQYVRDFGSKNQFKYIYGAGGDGNLMYADTSSNITREVIQFINDKYKGGK